MNNNNSSGFSVIGLLGVLFIGLKLTGYITWSWWWVLAPFWGGLALALVILLIIGVVALFIHRREQAALSFWYRR